MTTIRFRALLVAGICLSTLFGLAGSARTATEPSHQAERSLSSTLARPHPTSVRVQVAGKMCSGTVVAATGAGSIVLTCNHCFAHQPFPGASFPRADYPIRCQVVSLASGEKYDAIAVDGSADPDCALVVVDGSFPDAAVPGDSARPGDPVEHWGWASGHSVGYVTGYSSGDASGRGGFECSTCSSIPGDSGAGVFVRGKLIAINWGFYAGCPQAGTVLRPVRRLVASSTLVPAWAVESFGREPEAVGVPGLPPATVPPPKCVIPPARPLAPPQEPHRRVLFPRLRSILGR